MFIGSLTVTICAGGRVVKLLLIVIVIVIVSNSNDIFFE